MNGKKNRKFQKMRTETETKLNAVIRGLTRIIINTCSTKSKQVYEIKPTLHLPDADCCYESKKNENRTETWHN